jgi:hypothetical protein
VELVAAGSLSAEEVTESTEVVQEEETSNPE